MKNLGIRDKFLLIVIPLIICSYIILAISSNTVFYQDIIVRRQREVRDEVTIVSSQIQKCFANISNCCKVISRDLNYNENRGLVIHTPATPLEEYQKVTAIRSVLYDNAIFFPEVETLAFIDQNRELYVSDSRLQDNWGEAACDSLLAPLDQIGNVDVWIEAVRRDFLTTDPEMVIITLSKNIMNMKNGSQMGHLFINISEAQLRQYYEELESPGSSWYFITDQDGTIISASDQAELLTQIENKDILNMLSKEGAEQLQTELDGTEVIVTGVPMQISGYYLVNITSLEALKGPIDHLSFMVIIICTLTILVAIALIGYFSNKIARPLSELVTEIGKVENGNFKVNFPKTGNDEIGKLSTEFEYMMNRIDELFHTVETEQRQREKLRFSLLQSQIKPHFFYNTLDLVYVLISMNRTEDAERAVKALADFYRIALSSGKELIPIKDEIANVQNYLTLQYMRRYDVFSYEIDVDESIYHFQIPKLTLQPLVENAIYHGLRVQEKAGILRVTGYQEEKKIILKVSDTGAGMNAGQIQEVLQDSGRDGGHFGLRNVDERIKLYFGKEYGITIFSRKQEGTTVIVEIGKLEDHRTDE